MEVKSYTATELASLDDVTRQTVATSKKYIKVRFTHYRAKQSKKWYTIRYIRKSDIL